MKKNKIILALMAIAFSAISFLSINAAPNDDSKDNQLVVDNSTKFPINLSIGRDGDPKFLVESNKKYETNLSLPLLGDWVTITIPQLDNNNIAEVQNLLGRGFTVKVDFAQPKTLDFPTKLGENVKIIVNFTYDKEKNKINMKLSPA